MSAAPRIRSCDIDAALEAERKFGRPVRAITRDGVTIHFVTTRLQNRRPEIG
jgi:hypothetical protein